MKLRPIQTSNDRNTSRGAPQGEARGGSGETNDPLLSKSAIPCIESLGSPVLDVHSCSVYGQVGSAATSKARSTP